MIEIVKSEAIDKLAAALAKAQGKITHALANTSNPHLHTTYADLSSVMDASRAALSENGLAIIQLLSTGEAVSCKLWRKEGGAGRMIDSTGIEVFVDSILAHESGQYVTNRLGLVATENTPQAIGAVGTYARRYSWAALVGVATGEIDETPETSGREHPDDEAPRVERPSRARDRSEKPPEGRASATEGQQSTRQKNVDSEPMTVDDWRDYKISAGSKQTHGLTFPQLEAKSPGAIAKLKAHYDSQDCSMAPYNEFKMMLDAAYASLMSDTAPDTAKNRLAAKLAGKSIGREEFIAKLFTAKMITARDATWEKMRDETAQLIIDDFGTALETFETK